MQFYTDPARADDTYALPDAEVFHVDAIDLEDEDTCFADLVAGKVEDGYDRDEAIHDLIGFYWWCCFPGCMPEGDPMGPFATQEDAIADAREGF